MSTSERGERQSKRAAIRASLRLCEHVIMGGPAGPELDVSRVCLVELSIQEVQIVRGIYACIRSPLEVK